MIRLQAVMNFHNYSFFVSGPVGLIITGKKSRKSLRKTLGMGLPTFDSLPWLTVGEYEELGS